MQVHGKSTSCRMKFFIAALAGFAGAICLQTWMPSPAWGSKSDEEIVGPFVGATTVAILKIEPRRLELPPADKLVSRLPHSLQSEVAPTLRQLVHWRQQIMATLGENPLYVVVRIPASKSEAPAFVVAPLPEDQPAEPAKRLIQALIQREPIVQNHVLIAALGGSADIQEQLAKIDREDRPELWQALRAASRHPIQLAVAPPGYVRRTIDELVLRLPQEVGGGESSVWTKGVRSVACSVDPARLEIDIAIHSESEEAARALRNALPHALAAALKAAAKRKPTIPEATIAPMIADERFRCDGERVLWRFRGSKNESSDASALGALLGEVQATIERHKQMDRYKRLLMAIHRYHNVYHAFPPSTPHRPKNGRPVLSWRVYLLPFLGQQALYEQFRLDEPWDSPHNMALLEQMPDVYSIRRGNRTHKANVKPGYTTCVAPVGDGTIMGQAQPVAFRDILDGSGNTILLVEVDSEYAVPWTAPQDYPFDPRTPLAKIARYEGGLWLAGMCDGSVQMLRADITADLVLALFGMNDGKIIPLDRIR